MKYSSIIFCSLLLFGCAQSPISSQDTPANHTLRFNIHKSVTNAEDEDTKAIIELWKTFLTSKQFVRPNTPFWNYDHSPIPDYHLMKLYVQLQRNPGIDGTIIGIYPVDEDHYNLKCMFNSTDSTGGPTTLELIVSTFAKKEKDGFKLVGSPDFFRQQLPKRSIGNIHYYVHPEHDFSNELAQRMDSFNNEMAKIFDTDPIRVDYFVANNVSDATEIMGYDFTPKKYQLVQYGGLADVPNRTIYAGNNSEYYPHELVHLYTFQFAPHQHHRWIDEGIATFFGGSGGYPLDWHLGKLKVFLQKNPDFRLDNLSKLNTDIPNGEHKTDFRYAIGGLLCKKIYEQQGMEGFFAALRSGRTENDFFAFLKKQLGFEKAAFEKYIRQELKKLEFTE